MFQARTDGRHCPRPASAWPRAPLFLSAVDLRIALADDSPRAQRSPRCQAASDGDRPGVPRARDGWCATAEIKRPRFGNFPLARPLFSVTI